MATRSAASDQQRKGLPNVYSWIALPASVLMAVTLMGATGNNSASSASSSPARQFVACYVQGGSRSGGVVSQNYADFTDDSSQAADDFTLGAPCDMQRIVADGSYHQGYGPPASVAVTIYSKGSGKPGAVVTEQPSDRYTNPSQNGTLTVDLKPPLQLPAGTYWVSVAANMAYRAGGDWYWRTVSDSAGSPDVWQNPRAGFDVGCRHYKSLRKCLGGRLGPGLSFSILTRSSS
jgi:hypothetical protein